MTKKKSIWTLILAFMISISAILMLTACGSDDDTPPTPSVCVHESIHYDADLISHRTVCNDCGEIIEENTHNFEHSNEIPGNCLMKGRKECYICWDCMTRVNLEKSKIMSIEELELPIDPTNHGQIFTYEREEPTCTKDGQIAMKICMKCFQRFDAVSGEPKTDEETRIPATGHNYGVTGNCTNCGDDMSKTIDSINNKKDITFTMTDSRNVYFNFVYCASNTDCTSLMINTQSLQPSVSSTEDTLITSVTVYNTDGTKVCTLDCKIDTSGYLYWTLPSETTLENNVQYYVIATFNTYFDETTLYVEASVHKYVDETCEYED